MHENIFLDSSYGYDSSSDCPGSDGLSLVAVSKLQLCSNTHDVNLPIIFICVFLVYLGGMFEKFGIFTNIDTKKNK